MPSQDSAAAIAGGGRSRNTDTAAAAPAHRRLLDDAVCIANNAIYGLAGAVFSGDQDRALAVARRIRAGSFSINGGNYFAADCPFGGFKQSGVGREMGVAGLEEFLERKTLAVPVGPVSGVA